MGYDNGGKRSKKVSCRDWNKPASRRETLTCTKHEACAYVGRAEDFCHFCLRARNERLERYMSAAGKALREQLIRTWVECGGDEKDFPGFAPIHIIERIEEIE